jgi:hypothetical protein
MSQRVPLMRTMRSLSLAAFSMAISFIGTATPILAAPDTWVSAAGTDAGQCTFAAPCRTFQFAHNVTDGGGAIKVLSSGNFGHLRINRSISVDGNGFNAFINDHFLGAAIGITGGRYTVVLRGLTLEMAINDGGVVAGIGISSAAVVHVHNCFIRRYPNGIYFAPEAGPGELYVADTLISDTGVGIEIIPNTSSTQAKVTVEHTRVENSSGRAGIDFSSHHTRAPITATVRDSILTGNAGPGLLVFENAGGTTKVMVDRTASVNNGGAGINVSGPGAIVQIGDSTVHGNAIGLEAFDAGQIVSYGTNKVSGNRSDGAPTSSIAYK